MIRPIIFFIVVLFVTPNLGAFYVTTAYPANSGCSGSPVGTVVVQCGTCISVTSEGQTVGRKILCAGNSIIYQECDLSCGNCRNVQTISTGTCFEGSTIGTISTNFPVTANDMVVSMYTVKNCIGNPFSWTIQNLGQRCDVSMIPSNTCIDIGGEDGENVFRAARYDCGSTFSPPSSGSNTISGGSTSSVPTPPTAPPADCTITPGQCSFYENCVQRTTPCSSTDYALGYGNKYCSTYMSHINEFSASGRQWVQNTLVCLQQALKEVVQTKPPPTCAVIRSSAFSSHPTCYLGDGSSSVCFIASDWPLIMRIVGKALFTTSEGFNQAAITAGGCMESYRLSLVYKISDIQASASETLDSLLSKLSNLIGIARSRISIIDTDSPVFDYFSPNNKRANGNITASITFVFYADTDAQVQQYDEQVTTILQTQTIWPTATIKTCEGNNSTECKSSNEVIGPRPSSSSSGSNTGGIASSSSCVFSLFAVAFAFIAGLAVL